MIQQQNAHLIYIGSPVEEGIISMPSHVKMSLHLAGGQQREQQPSPVSFISTCKLTIKFFFNVWEGR
jgi:hypothetical protein